MGTAPEPTPPAPKRGAYAKGIAKREEILTRALEVIAREGYRGASVKELADAVGLSQAGLLHYFGSKEELFTEILRKRDELDTAALDFDIAEPITGAELFAGYVEFTRRNAEVPGLVQLFARLSVDAADPKHPAHRFFTERNALLRDVFAAAIARGQQAGTITDRIAPETLARVMQAVSDGLQVQFMLEPDIDMAAIMSELFDTLQTPGDTAEGEPA